MADIFAPIPIYQPRVLAATAVGTQVALLPRLQGERPTFTPDTRQCDVREANGGDGSFTLKDCDGAESAKIEWKKGIITTEGDSEAEAGCSGGSSSGFS